ncbi:hypothetical protein FIBSPDRAFT_1014610 [Athelia psychrophila]|uniref:Uncharacterized protein n=1 Tax=Athelia psychrophila TaxID=1759441 RepID=A0A166LX46_9AGAM|nr:hypothetical protein FIBSPDRAFT_1014610 [Fibularhizoctonia sp. CBS 109695]
MLVQLADCQSYMGTCRPRLSIFLNYVQEEFPRVLVEPGARKCWNDGRAETRAGIELIHQLCVYEDARAGTILAASDKYYALSAVCALFKGLKRCLDTPFSAHSLLICYVPVEHEDDRPRDCVQPRDSITELVKSEDLIKEVREAPRALDYGLRQTRRFALPNLKLPASDTRPAITALYSFVHNSDKLTATRGCRRGS